MGLLATLIGPLADLLADKSLPILILTAIIAFLSLSVVFNVLAQVLLKDTTKPPVVFHWVPFLGSTVTYGIDPIAFFQQNQQKVSLVFPVETTPPDNVFSMAISSPSSSLVDVMLYISGPRAMNSS